MGAGRSGNKSENASAGSGAGTGKGKRRRGLQASCDYEFTETIFRDYQRVRYRRAVRAWGVAIAAFGAFYTILVVCGLFGGRGLAAAVYLPVGLLILALGLVLALRQPVLVLPGKTRSFMRLHGADMSSRPWSFAEHIEVDEEGVTLVVRDRPAEAAGSGGSGGGAGQDGSDEAAGPLLVKKTWLQWARVVETPEYLVLLSRHGSTASLTLRASTLDEREVAWRLFKEDAVIPKAFVQGVAPSELGDLCNRLSRGFNLGD